MLELNKIQQGNCLDIIKQMADNSVDAIVTDPPYGLSFMGKKWDYDVPSVEIWQECLRVLKPGGYLLSFAGTRTQHRMAVRIEDAGFEIRDMIAWVYGSGFPKSLNIGKAVDKLQGNEREIIGKLKNPATPKEGTFNCSFGEEKLDTKGTSEWEGWGTALKPALEPITIARKPLDGTVAENCLKWGVGGINIDECRVGNIVETWPKSRSFQSGISSGYTEGVEKTATQLTGEAPDGRFPANLIHDGSDEVVELFPNTKSGAMNGIYKNTIMNGIPGIRNGKEIHLQQNASSGSAARFFYCAKASKAERNKGCDELEEKQTTGDGGLTAEIKDDGSYETASAGGKFGSIKALQRNFHPTVKPIALMEYLVKLVSREGATVLDPFAGSGSTLIACKKLNRNYIGCEMNEEYIKIAEARLNSY